MANWNKITMTDVGAALQAKVNAGLTTLKFTRVANRIWKQNWRLRQCDRTSERRADAGY